MSKVIFKLRIAFVIFNIANKIYEDPSRLDYGAPIIVENIGQFLSLEELHSTPGDRPLTIVEQPMYNSAYMVCACVL